MPRPRRRAVLSALLLTVLSVFVIPAGTAHAADPVDLFIESLYDSPDPVNAYAKASYTVWIGNRGPGAATAVTLTTELPSGVSFQPSPWDDRCTANAMVVTCDFATVWPNYPPSPVAIDLVATTAGSISLTFTVSAAEPDANPADNSQTETTTVVMPTEADIALELCCSAPAYAGQAFGVGAGVFNAGPAPATGATAVLRLPAGVSLVFERPCVPDGAELLCTVIGPVDIFPSTGLASPLLMVASAPGTYVISGYASADQPDPDTTNNSGSVTVTVAPAADTAVTITESADPTRPGQALTYTVTVTNNGPSPASNVSLTDEWSAAVPGGLALLSVSGSQGQCTLTARARVDCDFGELASGATATLTLRLRARGVGSVTNQAQVTAIEFDADTTNNAATETTSIR
jgi:uncharacterized repeat protein (TIGR01451 family)